jgi:thymidylate synthase (FAD)
MNEQQLPTGFEDIDLPDDIAIVAPRIFQIAESRVNYEDMHSALAHLGVSDWTSDALDDHALLTEFAGKSCYMSFDKTLNKNLTRVGGRNNEEYIQKGIIATHHGSVLEHSTVSFFLADVSRVVTHELVRHRAGTAFSQVSGRYVRVDKLAFYVPKILHNYPGAVESFIKTMSATMAGFKELEMLTGIDKMTDFGEKKLVTSALRRVLGNGCANHIVVTANHRTWRHIIAERTSPHAEEEIRVVAAQIAARLKKSFPAIYADMRIGGDDLEWVFEHAKV